MPLATLSIDLEAKLASFEAGMDKAARLAEKNAAATEASWKRAGATMAGIGASVAGLFAGFSLVDLVRSNIDALDALNDVADATGASIENISALEDLAKRTGTTMDVVTTSIVKRNGVLSDAAPDSAAGRALKSIGLEVEKLRALDPAEALRQVAVALSAYADDGNKARLVQELFGKSVREVAPLLKDLAEQTTLVGKVTSEEAAAAERFNKQLFEIQANSDAAKRALVSEFLPALNSVLTELRVGIEVFGGFGAAIAGVGLSNPGRSIVDRNEEIEQLTETLRKLKEEAKSPPVFFNAQANQAAQDRAQEQLEKQQKLVAYLKQVQALTVPQAAYSNEGRSFIEEKPSVGSVPGAKANTSGAGRVEQISEAQRTLAAYVAELQRELDKTEELTDQQKALNLLKGLGTAGEVPQVRELVLGLAQQVTIGKQDVAIRADRLRLTKEQEAAEKELADALYKLSGRADDDRKIKLTDALEKQLKEGVEYSAEELDKLVKGIAGISEQANETFGQLDELSKEFARNVQDAIGDTVLDTLKGCLLYTSPSPRDA